MGSGLSKNQKNKQKKKTKKKEITQKNCGYLSYSWKKMYAFVKHTVCLVTCLCAFIRVAYSVLSLCFVVSYSVFFNWRFSVKFSGKREISRHLLGVIIINDKSSEKDHWSMWKHWFKWVCTQEVKEKHIGKWKRLWSFKPKAPMVAMLNFHIRVSVKST